MTSKGEALVFIINIHNIFFFGKIQHFPALLKKPFSTYFSHILGCLTPNLLTPSAKWHRSTVFTVFQGTKNPPDLVYFHEKSEKFPNISKKLKNLEN